MLLTDKAIDFFSLFFYNIYHTALTMYTLSMSIFLVERKISHGNFENNIDYLYIDGPFIYSSLFDKMIFTVVK